MEQKKINWHEVSVDVRDDKSKNLPIDIRLKCLDENGNYYYTIISMGKGNAKYLRRMLKKAFKYLD